MNADLNEARIEAVKSATVIINGISRCLWLKDLDLLLINTLMVSQGISFYSITNEWSERNYRHVGLMYGGGIAILSILLMMIGYFIYLPLVIISIVLGRYLWLRRSLTLMTRSSKWHHNTLKVAKYLVLNAKATQKNSLFNESEKMSIKYTMLRYIKDRNSISGASYLNLFAHIDSEVNFYGMLHGVIDDVLLYAVEQEVSSETNTFRRHQKDSSTKQSHFSKNMHHTGNKAGLLEAAPETTQKEVAKESMQAFTSALLSVNQDKQDPDNTGKNIIDEKKEAQENQAEKDMGFSEEDESQVIDASCTSTEVTTDHESKDISDSTDDEPLVDDRQVSSFGEGAQEDNNEDGEDGEDGEERFNLDDLDDDDFELEDKVESSSVTESESESHDELDDMLEDIDDDTLKSLGLTEDDLK